MDHYRARLLASLLFLILTATAIVLRRPVLHPPPAPLQHSAAPYLSKPETSGQARAIETKQPPVRTETSQAKQAAAGAPEGAAQPAAEARASEPQNAFQTANTKPVEQVTPAFPERMAGTTIYTVRAGESVESIASHFLSQTSFMTSGELVSAIRVANPDLAKALHAGQQLVIPGVEAAIVERPVRVPRGLEVRGIYLTGWTAGSEKGLELIRRWREDGGNTVVFDAKDFDGLVNVPFSHPLVPNQPHILIHNLPKFARFLHGLGLHAIARIALFRDQFLLEQHPELAVRSRSSGRPWRENGKLVWTDPSRLEVQEYNLALARLVAKSGVDEIQFDYVRFPAEGDQKDAKFAFESAHPDWQRSDVIADFLSRAYAELHPLGVLVSLDVFGVMAWQRQVDLDHTGQDIPAMARHCDVLSPMIYPSHFYGMDGYATPGNAPEHFIGESMDRFREVTADTGVVLRPWLQAFAWRTSSYSPAYVRIQVSVAKSKGGVGFLFWNARNDYTKVFPAMTEMRAKPGQFFRGDQVKIGPAPSPAKEPSS